MSDAGVEWRASGAAPALGGGEVHVWRVDLDAVPSRAPLAPLSVAERARAARFRFAADRARFTAGRRVLRSLLAGYTGESPERLEIAEGEGRKPRLVGEAVRFNVTHSGGVALVAVARDVEIGIDVEHVREIDDWQALAARLYTPDEVRALHDETADPRLGFLTCWTRKEAFVKYTGNGLDDSLHTIHVGTRFGTVAIDDVRIDSFVPDPATVAGIAVAAGGAVTRYYRFQA